MDPYERQMIDSIRLQVRVELTEHEMLQTELSEVVGVSTQAMNRYLQGHRTFPMPTFFKVAEAFGMTPSELIGKAEARVSRNRAAHDAAKPAEAELTSSQD